MKKVLSILLLIAPALVFGQLESEKNDFYLLSPYGKNNPNDSSKHWVNFSMAYSMNSNAVTNDFLKSLLFRGYIGEAEKDQVSPRLNAANRGGYEFNGGITYKNYLSSKWSLIVGLYARQQFNAKFSKDAFELAFRGNRMYSGENAEISPLKINYFNYKSLMLGLSRTVNNSLRIGGGISFINGGELNFATVKDGSIYTDTNGAYIDIKGNYNFGFTQKKSSNGIGAAMNFFITWNNNKGQWNFEARDIGFVTYKNVTTYSGNVNYRYDGVNVQDILSFDQSIFDQLKADSLAKRIGLTKENKNKTFFIPANFHLSYLYDLSEKVDVAVGVKQMLNVGYVPRVYAKGIYYLRKDLILVPMLAYGGFGKADFELGIAKSFKNDFVVSANAFYLEYFTLAKKTSGNGFNVSVTTLF